MIKVSIIGFGNLAQHLITAFEKAESQGCEIKLVEVYARKTEGLSALVPFEKICTDLDQLAAADLYILAVSDSAIAEVSLLLPFKNRLVVHTSGGVPLDDLDHNNRKGVFYPVQSFTKNKEIDFSGIPIGLESQNSTDFQLIKKVASAISNAVFVINSDQRKALHLAAVFVNNFSNHLYSIADAICEEHHLPFEILKPLIRETTDKIMLISPDEAQTGPAKRGDTETIQAHLELITNENQRKIYQLLTQSILNNGTIL